MTWPYQIMLAMQQCLLLADRGTVNAKMGNTGNGVVKELSFSAPAFAGVYQAQFQDVDTFTVMDPKGNNIGTGQLGEAFGEEGIVVQINGGTVPFIAGDAFALTALPATIAGPAVDLPRDWPATVNKYPRIMIQPPDDNYESKGPNGTQFDVTTSIPLVARLATLAEAGDAGAQAALAASIPFREQILKAIVNRNIMWKVGIQEFRSIRIKTEIKNEGEMHIAELNITFDIVFFAGTEDFAWPVMFELEEFAAYADLVNVFDPAGAYTPPFEYEINPAPRIAGPDGRVEAGALLTFETDQ